MESAPPSSFAALLAGLEQLDDEQIQVLISRAQGILLDRVAADHVPPLSVEIVDREEGCMLRAYRSLASPIRSQVLRYMCQVYGRTRHRLGPLALRRHP